MSEFIRRGLKNATYLTAGNLVAQLIAIIGFSYIAIMLGPEELGKYSTVISFVAMFSFVSLPGIDRVMLIEGSKDLEKMDNLMSKHFNLKTIFTFLSVILCIIVSYIMPYENAIFKLILIFSVSLLFRAVIGFFAPVFQAHERMEYLSFFRIFRSLSFSLMAIAVLYFGFGVLHVILMSLFSTIITAYLYYTYSRNFLKINFVSKPKEANINTRSIAIFSLITLIMTASQRSDIIFLSISATIYEVGLYAIPYAIILKLTMVRNTLAIGFSPTMVKEIKKGTFPSRNYFSYSLFLLVTTGMCAFIIRFLSEFILSFFGQDFSSASEILKLLIFSVPIIFATVPFTLFLQSTGNEVFVLLSVSLAFLLKIPLYFFLYGLYGVLGVVYSSLAFNIISLIFLFLSTYLLIFKGHNKSDKLT